MRLHNSTNAKVIHLPIIYLLSKKQNPKFSYDALSYSIRFPNPWKFMVYYCKYEKNITVMKNSCCYF